jgi:hypothetical protein
MSSVFDDRTKALEDRFFADQDATLVRQIQADHVGDTRLAALAAASGLTDDATLKAIDELGVNPETLVALQLIPLVAVAWADGQIQATERNAILAAAEDCGIGGSPAARKLLVSWLERNPGSELIDAWKGYASAMLASLTPEAADVMRRRLLAGARDVATAAGGFLGVGSISDEEKSVLDGLADALR